MKSGADFGRFEHRHVVGQFGVEGFFQDVGAQLAGGLKTDHLAQRMHARVGAPAGRDADRLSGDLRDRRFERALQRARPLLPLPAGVVRAIVSECEFEGSHAKKFETR